MVGFAMDLDNFSVKSVQFSRGFEPLSYLSYLQILSDSGPLVTKCSDERHA